MSLKEIIETEYKNALKSQDKPRISTFRLILSSIKDLDILNRSGPNKKETDDEDIKKLLKKMVKQRAESIDIYKKNNRNEENDFDRLIENVTDEQLRQHLYSPEAPDIDLIIRTSGESRLSGFLLWQSAYSEVIFQDVYWPEFRKIDFLRCLREYAQRERRFGQ